MTIWNCTVCWICCKESKFLEKLYYFCLIYTECLICLLLNFLPRSCAFWGVVHFFWWMNLGWFRSAPHCSLLFETVSAKRGVASLQLPQVWKGLCLEVLNIFDVTPSRNWANITNVDSEKIGLLFLNDLLLLLIDNLL